MSIDWIKFVPALLLLLTPIALFHGRGVRYRSLPASFEGYWGRTFALGLHTIDLVRAILGGSLLVQSLEPAPELLDPMNVALNGPQIAVLATTAAVLLVAILLQTFVCKEEDAANPPFAFAIGVVLGFLPLAIAGSAIFVAIMAAFGIRSVSFFFPLLSFTVMGAGALFFGHKSIFSAGAVAAVMLTPWLFTLLFPRHFVIAYAARKTTRQPQSLEK